MANWEKLNSEFDEAMKHFDEWAKRYKSLTEEQKRALRICRAHGSIDRYDGGFWAAPNAELIKGVPKDYIGTNTLKALLKRNIIKVTKEAVSARGKFAVQYQLVESDN
jgi:hypothetical protein